MQGYSPAHMKALLSACVVLLGVLAAPDTARAQDPTGAIEGTVTDKTSSGVAGARLTARHLETGFTREAVTGSDGFFRLMLLPVGPYSVTARAPQFAPVLQEPIQVAVSQTVRMTVRLELSSLQEAVTVSGGAQLVDTSTNALGRVVTGRELVELPLKGRNYTQLGLLQTGVAPLTFGVATAGGSLRQGQSYAVNGMRPEQNIYLVDGVQNMNRMDAGYALKVPVDAIAEFRILTQSAPPEYGGTGGATTSVVTRSGGNQQHGSLYDFVRNDAFDARNFFSREVEPLNQHQAGGTYGGPLRANRAFGFAYYEGFYNKQGITTTATVPTAQERQGDFSGLPTPLLNIAAGGVPFPGNQLPAAAINPVARNVVALYPLGNVSPSIYRDTLVGRNRLHQAGGRVDFNASSTNQYFGRYSFSGGHNINPISVRGTDVPGYPTRDDLNTHSVLFSNTRIFSPTVTHALRVSWFRHEFLFSSAGNPQSPIGSRRSAVRGRQPFTTRVLSAVRRIPVGRVATYGDVAAAAGKPRAARAVGNIMRECRTPGVPCHRVIAAAGRLGGYGGNLELKRALLRAEGILVSGSRIKQFDEKRWVRRRSRTA
jgi:O-6-methylguanine DNA methyltransferase